MSLNADHRELGQPPDAPQLTAIIIAKQSLLVLCGPAGSGKSTFARTLRATAIVSSDRCRAMVCDDEAVRKALLDIAHRFNAQTCLFVFAMTLHTCLEQNQHRHRTHRIPADMIASQVQQLQQVLSHVPHEEGWDQIRIFNEHHRKVQILITPS